MNPQQAQLQQQMLYMQQQQQFGGMPGIHPGAMPGVHPGAMPGVHPGSMPAVHPGGMPRMYPQPVPQGSPEPSANHLPVVSLQKRKGVSYFFCFEEPVFCTPKTKQAHCTSRIAISHITASECVALMICESAS
jgi:hypothetical protein